MTTMLDDVRPGAPHAPSSEPGTTPAPEATRVAWPDEVPNNVPAALSSLVGRTREVAALTCALGEARLLTLIGPGGAGKTRLARELAAAAASEHACPGGVWWVELAPVGSGSDVAAATAAVLGVTLPPGRPPAAVLADALQEIAGAARRVLLVLDNCEHLLDDVALLAEPLLRGAPDLAILATSREALAIEGEVAWPVPPLARPRLPDPGADARPDPSTLAGYEAVQLFVDRARGVVPGFALDATNAAAVAKITARLDGLPLALELAAAALPALGIGPLAARLDDALGVLTRGRRTAAPRHRTLHAVLDWSYQLLADDERVLLRRLSVFRAPFTLDALETVCLRPDVPGDPLRDAVRALGRLVEHSLVEVREDGGEVRYRLLETVRQFGAALLGATPDERETRARHARWVADLAAAAEPLLFSPARGRTVRQLQREVDEIRSALAWATRLVDGRPVGEPMTGVRIAGALGWFWFSGVPWEEARALLTATLAAADAEGVADAVRPLADRVALGTFFYPHTGQHYFASDTEAMLSLTARELALWDTVVADAARPAALTAAQRLALARGRSLAHQLRALALAMSGNADAAVPEMTRSVAVADAGGDAWLAAVMTTRRALVHLLCGDAAAADAAYRAAIPLLRALGEWWFLSLTYEGMAAGALLAGDVAGGVRDARLGVRVLRADRDEWFASRSLDTLAALLATDGARRAAGADDTQAVTAVRLLGAADGLRRRCGALPFGPDRARQEGVVRRLRAWLGDGAYATAHAAGAAMSLDEVFAFVDDDAPFAALGAAGSADGADVSRVPSEGAVRETHADGRPAAVARTLHVSLLGSFALRAGDAPLPREVVPVGKARELLLWLLLHAQGTKEEIALALWPDASAAQVRNTFHVTLHHLRRQLGDPHWITHERGVYRMLRRGDDGRRLEVDVDAVLAAAARLRAAARARTNAAVATAGADGEDPSAAAHALDAAALDDLGAALERWHGDLAGDSATGDWIAAHRARVHEAWADGMEALATLLAARGRHEDARDACERLLRREPLRESVHRQLMTTLAALGKRADALAHYAALVDQLRRDLGVPPSAQTQALAKQLAATS